MTVLSHANLFWEAWTFIFGIIKLYTLFYNYYFYSQLSLYFSFLLLFFLEYLKFCRSNCPGHLYDKPVVMKALDNLIDFELIISGKAAITASTGLSTAGSNNKTIWSSSSTLPNYRPLFCYVDSDILTACLDTYPNCPVELRYWIHSRTFWLISVIFHVFFPKNIYITLECNVMRNCTKYIQQCLFISIQL